MLFSNFFIELNHYQRFKSGQVVCGDSFISRRSDDDNRIISVLSDGLGSGIKASVLSTLTASMALNYALTDRNLEKAAITIMNTLPVDPVRKISYSTFTIVDLDYQGNCYILNYDNPAVILMRKHKIMHLDKQVISGSHAKNRTYKFTVSSFKMKEEDRLIFYSDGVSQSGIGSPRYPLGWEYADIVDYLTYLYQENPYISARAMSYRIVDHALANSDYKAKDDITCAVIYIRKPRKLLIISGPSIDMSKDSIMAERLAEFSGKTAICGGSTAKIVARELNRNLVMDIDSIDPHIPCCSRMDDVDLVTEGMITLAKTLEIMENNCPIEEMNKNNGAAKLVHLIQESDEIEFLIGTKINDAHQDPNLPLELGIRRNTVKSLSALLNHKYFKKTSISYL